MPNKEKEDLRVLVTIKDDQNFGDPMLHFEAHVVAATAEGMRNPGGNSYEPNGLEDLQVRAQLGTYQRQVERANAGFYGYNAEYYNVYSAKLGRLTAMVKTLKSVEAKIAKYEAQFGYPDDLATYMAYFANAIGCTDPRPFGREVSRTRSGSYADIEYGWMDASALRHWIVGEIQKWMKDKNLTVKAES